MNKLRNIEMAPLEKSFITFKVEKFYEGKDGFELITVSAEVIRIITDPLNKREPKCLVELDNKQLGIPLSEIISVKPPNGFQLSLF
ncbi:MAG: hypothetical protein GX587_15310 [Bacteroidales bacterium]|nr:hypothetical protein [Bacteroidales bacterium]